MKVVDLIEAVADILNAVGTPVVAKEVEKKEEDTWKPKLDENGLMNDVEELRELVHSIRCETLKFLIGLDDPSLKTQIRALQLIQALNTVHDLKPR